MEEDIKNRMSTLSASNLVDPTQEQKLNQLKSQIEPNMSHVLQGLKELIKAVSEIKNYRVDSFGDSENRIKD